MSDRITKTELRDRVDEINRLFGDDLAIMWAYGKPRVYRNQGSKEVSPRLPMRQMYHWLDGYVQGKLSPSSVVR